MLSVSSPISPHACRSDLRSADIDRYRCRGVGSGSHTRGDNAHDPVEADRDAVAGASVCRGQDCEYYQQPSTCSRAAHGDAGQIFTFGRVGVERAVVDVQTEADRTIEPEVLCVGLDLRVRKEEGHRDQRTDDHGATAAPEEAGLAHVSRQDWRRNGAGVGCGQDYGSALPFCC